MVQRRIVMSSRLRLRVELLFCIFVVESLNHNTICSQPQSFRPLRVLEVRLALRACASCLAMVVVCRLVFVRAKIAEGHQVRIWFAHSCQSAREKICIYRSWVLFGTVACSWSYASGA
jgi:hypothetical protein